MPVAITKTLAELQTAASNAVDTLAGQTRLRFITSIPGQDASYLSKLADAKAYQAAGNPADATPYTWVNAEAQARNITPTAMAALIVSTASNWDAVGAQIEAARQGAKLAIAAATTAQQVHAAGVGFVAEMDKMADSAG